MLKSLVSEIENIVQSVCFSNGLFTEVEHKSLMGRGTFEEGHDFLVEDELLGLRFIGEELQRNSFRELEVDDR